MAQKHHAIYLWLHFLKCAGIFFLHEKQAQTLFQMSGLPCSSRHGLQGRLGANLALHRTCQRIIDFLFKRITAGWNCITLLSSLANPVGCCLIRLYIPMLCFGKFFPVFKGVKVNGNACHSCSLIRCLCSQLIVLYPLQAFYLSIYCATNVMEC